MGVAWPIHEFHPQCSFLVECKSRIELSDHTISKSSYADRRVNFDRPYRSRVEFSIWDRFFREVRRWLRRLPLPIPSSLLMLCSYFLVSVFAASPLICRLKRPGSA